MAYFYNYCALTNLNEDLLVAVPNDRSVDELSPYDIEYEVKKSISLFYITSGYPIAELKVDTSNVARRMIGELVINEIAKEEEGTLSCILYNKLARRDCTTYTLDVYYDWVKEVLNGDVFNFLEPLEKITEAYKQGDKEAIISYVNSAGMAKCDNWRDYLSYCCEQSLPCCCVSEIDEDLLPDYKSMLNGELKCNNRDAQRVLESIRSKQ